MPPDRRGAALAAELLRAGRPVSLRATGGSMAPAICSGDRVELRPALRTPSPGDIALVARPNGGALLHRVIEVRQDLVLLGGDTNPAHDQPVPREWIVGVVERVRPSIVARIVHELRRLRAAWCRALGDAG